MLFITSHIRNASRNWFFIVLLAMPVLAANMNQVWAQKTSKAFVCHFDNDVGTWKLIHIAEPAVAAHLGNHDDVLSPPGLTAFSQTELNETCNPVPAIVCACFNADLLASQDWPVSPLCFDNGIDTVLGDCAGPPSGGDDYGPCAANGAITGFNPDIKSCELLIKNGSRLQIPGATSEMCRSLILNQAVILGVQCL